MQVRELVVAGVGDVVAADLCLVAVGGAHAVRERVHEPVRLLGELGVVEDDGRDALELARDRDRRPHDPGHHVGPEFLHDLEELCRTAGHLGDEPDAAAALVGDVVVGELVLVEQVERPVLVPGRDVQLVTARLHLGVEVAEEVDVRGMEDVDEDAHCVQVLRADSLEASARAAVVPMSTGRCATARTPAPQRGFDH